jgi:hypothetical protein
MERDSDQFRNKQFNKPITPIMLPLYEDQSGKNILSANGVYSNEI